MSDHPPSLTALGEARRAQALARFRILQPFLEDGVPLARIAREQGVAVRTAQRWAARYRRGGLAALARQARAGRGVHRLPARLQRLIEDLALRRPRRSIAAVHRQAVAVAEREGWPAPSYKQAYAIVRGLDPALVALAHGGDRDYREGYDLVYRREAARPNEVWQADHTHLDLWLVDDRDQPARPWLTVILDEWSRAVAGYLLGFAAPSALGTALALHRAIWRKGDARWPVCGIPEVLYTDHGSDFTSRHLEQVAADLQIRLVFSLPGRPRGRGKLERFFGTVNQLFLCEQPGYAPSGAPMATPALTLPAFDARFHAWLLDEYHERVHSETKAAPRARWAGGAFLPRMPDSLEQLDLLLLTVPKTRRVRPDGIHFQGWRYLNPTLAAYVGEEVTIRYDPRDLGEIRVFHREGFLCRAVCAEFAGETVTLKAITAARDRRRRDVQRQLAERAGVVEALTAAHRADEPATVEPVEAPPAARAASPRLKRYVNE